jgi:acyl-CoA synthetase (AMP-forming)/AMP-acid ligase II
VIAGAERLAEPVRVAWFERFGIRVLEGYGATETAPVLAINTPMAYGGGTVGQLLPGLEARIEPVPGIEHGGGLHVRGPNLMSGYYRDAAPGVLDSPIVRRTIKRYSGAKDVKPAVGTRCHRATRDSALEQPLHRLAKPAETHWAQHDLVR